MFEPEEIEEGFEEMFAHVRRGDLGCFFGDDEPDLVDVVREVNGPSGATVERRRQNPKREPVGGKSGWLVTPRFVTLVRAYCEELRRNAQEVVSGGAEEQLRQPIASLIRGVGDELLGKLKVAMIGETPVQGIGRPDYSVTVDGLLCGYCELKAPDKDIYTLKGRDRQQFQRFAFLPNILYTNGEQWALYRGGVLIGKATFAGPPQTYGDGALSESIAQELLDVFRAFLQWEPPVPSRPADLAKLLAPLCRLLRDEVREALRDKNSRMRGLAYDWRNFLFPKASDAQVADACAQIVTYGLLLARTDYAHTTDLEESVRTLSRNGHGVIAKALRLIFEARDDLGPSLSLLQRIIDRVEPRFDKLGWSKSDGGQDGSAPIITDSWIYFYEDFLKEYDPSLRERYGVYYTPISVVEAQVRMVESVLRGRLGLASAFAEPDVVTLDPAVGTGTYLLAILKSSLRTGTEQWGKGAASGIANQLGRTLHGFEKLAGPYAVAELRVAGALLSIPGAQLPDEGVGIVLADTLADPNTVVQPSLIGRELAAEHAKARRIKSPEMNVMVVIGNPPYDRHGSYSKAKANEDETGGWVRHGARSRTDGRPLLEDFARPVRDAGKGRQLKNLYNFYAYFWRWAGWKAFEQHPQDPGIVCFITASSFLAGDAFIGVRSYLRAWCDEVWVLDLGGDNRGGRSEANVFDIETPVCITLAFRRPGRTPSDAPATVRVRRIEGTRSEKYQSLRLIATAQDPLPGSNDQNPPNALPALEGHPAKAIHTDWREVALRELDRWSAEEDHVVGLALNHIFPWVHSGLEMKRRWPIAATEGTLVRRWHSFLGLSPEARAKALVETESRKISAVFTDETGSKLATLGSLGLDSPAPQIRAIMYRPWDERRYFADPRLGDRLRPDLAQVVSNENIILVTLTNTKPVSGPLLLATRLMPDRHFFRDSYGAKDAMPLYRDPYGENANLTSNLLTVVEAHIGKTVSPDELADALLGILGTGAFGRVLGDLIPTLGGPRVPLPVDHALWAQCVTLGSRVRSAQLSEITSGIARLIEGPELKPDEWRYENGEIVVGKSGRFGPVSESVVNYSVSGYLVVKGWIEGRLASPRKTGDSSLDLIGEEPWTLSVSRDFLKVLWSLEKMEQLEHEAEELLTKLRSEEWITSEEVAIPTDEERRPPNASSGTLFH